MPASPPPKSKLLSFLRTKSPRYYGEVLKIRDAISDWLVYIPESFPHYTQHTIKHSDEVIGQLSNLLFPDRRNQPELDLSATEAYILIAAAYFHDAGMVVSNREKTRILGSDEWVEWTTNDGGGARRWRDIEAFRNSDVAITPTQRDFLTNLWIRHLLSEFVRKNHHYRSGNFITEYEDSIGSFTYGDPMLRAAITNLCIAHGLERHELENAEKFPDRCDIAGERVNVRFLAFMLRIADLLDMRHDRGCPLLINAACPLPPDSYAHWSQYQRISQRLTSPQEIKVAAKCQTQEEHRFLLDWCKWLVEEVRNAAVVMSRSSRHSEWRSPLISLDGDSPTIQIQPAEDATYFFSEWKFELDHNLVFQRLIYDVYDAPLTFIRELIQNALDATRSQMYVDMKGEGIALPQYPTQAEPDRRERYPICVSLKTKDHYNELSGECEQRQVLIVEDIGIGMDRDIIRRYFLQIGRSYYQSNEFRRSFPFSPTSRFGVGFLSVFAESDNVVVETFKPTSSNDIHPIRLTLHGPQNYLLTEGCTRSLQGTRIAVILRGSLWPGTLTEHVKMHCKRVEFPVIVDDLGVQTTVVAERPDEFICEVPNATEEGAALAIRSFPVNRDGIEGELYVFALRDRRGESWAAWDWARYTYPQERPTAIVPEIPNNLTCFHGIAATDDRFTPLVPMSERLDFRKDGVFPTLSRRSLVRRTGADNDNYRAIVSRWEEILTEHLQATPRAVSDDGWRYKQRLAHYFRFPDFWSSVPGTIPLVIKGERQLVSLVDAGGISSIIVTIIRVPATPRRKKRASLPNVVKYEPGRVYVHGDDLQHLSDEHRAELFSARTIREIRTVDGQYLEVEWIRGINAAYRSLSDDVSEPVGAIKLLDPSLVGGALHKTTGSVYDHVVMNTDHPLVKWLLRLRVACEQKEFGLSDQYNRTLTLALTPLRQGGYRFEKLAQYLEQWEALAHLPDDLRPPKMSERDCIFGL